MRGLWSIGVRFSPELLEELENTINRIHNEESWIEGWISIKSIIRYDGELMGLEARSRLKDLSEQIKPTSLLEQARLYALTPEGLSFDIEDDFDENDNASEQGKRIQEKTRQTGILVARDLTVFNKLLPELVSNFHHRLSIFGSGLAEGCENRKSMWEAFYKQTENTPSEKRQIAVMLGFLSFCAVHDVDLCDLILNTLINDPLLGRWFPYFQLNSKIDKKGVERLHKALDEGDVDIYSFKQLSLRSRHEGISDDDFAKLLQKLTSKDNGIRVAADILNMRLHMDKGESDIYSKSLMSVSCEILLQYPYEDRQQYGYEHPDHWLAEIVTVSLRGEEGLKSTKELCKILVKGFEEHRIYSFHYPQLLKQLAYIQPNIFLDTFMGKDDYMFRRRTFSDFERSDSPVNHIPEDILLTWCEQDPETRYPLIVSCRQIYSKSKDSEELIWHPILYTIFEKSPNIQDVLLRLEREIYPMSWSGSQADAIAKRFSLFDQLTKHKNSEIRDWARAQNQKLEITVQEVREQELKQNRDRFERFE